MPRGVQGRRPNWRSARWPTFSGWKPSTSLRGSMRWISCVASRRSGRGNCTRMPWTSGSALSRSISASNSASLVVGRQVVVDARGSRPSRAARRLLRTYTRTPGRCRPAPPPGPGAACPTATRASTCAFRLSSSSSAMRLPSRMRAGCIGMVRRPGVCWSHQVAHCRRSALQPRGPAAKIRERTHDRHRFRNHADRGRRLPPPLQHLMHERADVQNIDLMILAGFCRNCLSDWYREAAEHARHHDDQGRGARSDLRRCPSRNGRRKHQQRCDARSNWPHSKPRNASRHRDDTCPANPS